MQDITENIRREAVQIINTNAPTEREQVEKLYGQVWNTEELSRDYSVLGFMAPFVVVKRKSDGAKGSLMFQHSPRFYFNFRED
jgi:hypothetical protein